MVTQLEKWLGYWSPLIRGRFDFFVSADGPRHDAWHQGLALTGGRFWVRHHGGHDLRRVLGPAPEWSPSLSCVLVGRSDGRRVTVTTFPWVCHAAEAEYVYGLSVVGAGGVPDVTDAPLSRAAFDEAGALIGPAPNRVGDLAVEPLSGGRLALRWTYDEAEQETAPSAFRVYNDEGSCGTVNYEVVVATVAYRFRRGYFSWTSGAFAHGSRVTWAVRAASAAGAEGPASPLGLGVAAAAPPAAPQGMRITAAGD
ncbi:MAG: hypothetical protein JXQ75_07035 [Phycisphaerae bacterium]|nr:hypothetical protein [Phycisphaerae bacterium]